MARDYAKAKKKGSPRTSSRSKPAKDAAGRGIKLYLAGFVSGVFISFLAYLATIAPTGAPETPQADSAQAEAPPPKPRFDFYTMLPEQTIEVDVPEVERLPEVEIEIGEV